MNTYQKLFELIGIKGDIYSLEFGDKFKVICGDLDLDDELIKKYIFDYSLFELYKEQCRFSDEDIYLMETNDELVLLEKTLGDILDIKYCNSSESYYENFGYLLNDKQNKIIMDKEKNKLIEAIQKTSKVVNNYYEIEGTFFNIFKDKLKRHQQPFNKAADKINIVKDIDKFKGNTLFYLKQLRLVKNINYTEDLIEFEKSSNLIFNFYLYNLIQQNRDLFNRENESYYFNTLSSLCIIDNIYLKMYIAKIMVTEESLFEYPVSEFHYLLHKTFIIGVIYPILIKLYLKSYFFSNSKEDKTFELKSTDGNTNYRIENLKRRSLIYESLYKNSPYKIDEFINLIQPIEVTDRSLYKSLYSKISSVHKAKNKYEMTFIEEYIQFISLYGNKEELTECDIRVILEGNLIEYQNKIISKWRNER